MKRKVLTWLKRRSEPFHDTGSMHHTRNKHFTTRYVGKEQLRKECNELHFKRNIIEIKPYLRGFITRSRSSSIREKTPRTTQYRNQAPALSGDPWRTALSEAKAGQTTPTRVLGTRVYRSMAAECVSVVAMWRLTGGSGLSDQHKV